MKKKLISLLLCAVMLCGLVVTAAAQSDVSVVIDGEEVAFSDELGYPFVDENGRTQVPLRVVMEAYGCEVTWDAKKNAAVITQGDTTVVVPIGAEYILVNGETVAMDTAALIRDGRTYLPIRAVLEAFGAEVGWDNGTVSVVSAAAAAEERGSFDNIYVDDNGDLIFETANGNTINVGHVAGEDGRDGYDGADGISVSDAYVDGSGDLIIVLSSGRSINAGNVSTGGSLSSLTFADYAVGTSFYLTEPTGAFEVELPANDDDESYVVSIDSVSYELIGKYGFDDEEAWVREYEEDERGNRTVTSYTSRYVPYRVAVTVEGETDPALAGYEIGVSLYDIITTAVVTVEGEIEEDGSFDISLSPGVDTSSPWYAPRTLYFRSVDVSYEVRNKEDEEDTEPEEPDMAFALEMLAATMGTWESKKGDVFIIDEDYFLVYDDGGYPLYEFLLAGVAIVEGDKNGYTLELPEYGWSFTVDLSNSEITDQSGVVYYRSSEDDSDEGTNTEDVTAALKEAAGTWISAADVETKLILTEDGDVNYKGEDYTASCQLQQNVLVVSFDDNTFRFYGDIAQNSAEGTNDANGYYFKEGAWDIVTITKDNFLDYYELQVSAYYRFDVFDEYESTEFNYKLVLKDEYYNRVNAVVRSSPVIKVKYSHAEYEAKATVDPEAKTYTLTPTDELIRTYENSTKGLRSFGLTSTAISGTSGTVRYPMDIQILNAAGTLFLAKD